MWRDKKFRFGPIRVLLKSARYRYEESNQIARAATANRWQAALCPLNLAPDETMEQVYGSTGNWLLRRKYPDLALECWLNAMRVLNQELFAKDTSMHLRALDRIRDLETASRACGREQLASLLGQLRRQINASAEAPQVEFRDKIDKLIWLETSGHESALELCTQLADEFIQSNSEHHPHHIRLVADGMFLAGDLDRAGSLYRSLINLESCPEDCFVPCLLRATPSAVGVPPTTVRKTTV